MNRGVLKWLLVNTVFITGLAAALFLSVGRWNWLEGWAYLGIIFLGQTATTIMLLWNNPSLLVERAWFQPGSKGWDKILVSILDLGWFLLLITAGLDERFGWSPALPSGMVVIGWVILPMGYILFLWAMMSNRYFSTFVRIQTDRGHAVITNGPYRYIRHPGYVGAILMYLATPLALKSQWSILPVGILVVLYGLRTALEDRTLLLELKGYEEYAQKVRYRLFPGIW